jgi:ketosteroid isomerase-like protein
MQTTTTTDLAATIEASHRALDAFAAGDPEPLKALYSHAYDVTLANPFGPPVRGRPEVEETMGRAATHYRDGRAVEFERVSLLKTHDLACLVEIERYEAKIGGATELASVALRVTTIFRPEEGVWRIAHRHADPTVSAQSAEVVVAA